MRNRSRTTNRVLAAVLAAGALGGAGLAVGAGPANAATIYTLTKTEKKAVCGGFGGTIIYSDGYSVDCSSGQVSYTEPVRS